MQCEENAASPKSSPETLYSQMNPGNLDSAAWDF